MEAGVCSCDCDMDGPTFYSVETRKANKQHVCCECRETIVPGEKYRIASGVWDGRWNKYKTCLPCWAIGKDWACECWPHGGLRQYVMDVADIDYLDADACECSESDEIWHMRSRLSGLRRELEELLPRHDATSAEAARLLARIEHLKAALERKPSL